MKEETEMTWDYLVNAKNWERFPGAAEIARRQDEEVKRQIAHEIWLDMYDDPNYRIFP